MTAKELSRASGLGESAIDPVLRRLSEPDLHILRPVAKRDRRGDTSYEIFHDGLARPIIDWGTRKERTDKAELEARMRRRIWSIAAIAVGLAAALVVALLLASHFRAQRNHAQQQLRQSQNTAAQQLRESQLAVLKAVPPTWKFEARGVAGKSTASGVGYTHLAFTSPGKHPMQVAVDSSPGQPALSRSQKQNEQELRHSPDYRRIEIVRHPLPALLEWVYLARHPAGDAYGGQLERSVDFFFNARKNR